MTELPSPIGEKDRCGACGKFMFLNPENAITNVEVCTPCLQQLTAVVQESKVNGNEPPNFMGKMCACENKLGFVKIEILDDYPECPYCESSETKHTDRATEENPYMKCEECYSFFMPEDKQWHVKNTAEHVKCIDCIISEQLAASQRMQQRMTQRGNKVERRI